MYTYWSVEHNSACMCIVVYGCRKRPRMSNPKMSNPRMSNPKMSNAKMSNRVLISTVPGESTWNVINTIILKCSSVFPLGFLAQREVGSPFLWERYREDSMY